MKILRLLLVAIGCLFANLQAQEITIFPNDYKQVFEGGGATCGLYLSQYTSMTRENQLLASKMLYEDIHLNYIRFFPQPTDPNERFDRFANFVRNARVYNPSVKVMINLNRLPDALTVIRNRNYIPNLDVPNLINRVISYYMEVFEKLKARGIDVDYFEPVNETSMVDGTLALFTRAVPGFKARLNNSRQNPNNIKIPLITGPSPWNAASIPSWINELKSNTNGIGWRNLDILATHGYQNGTEAVYRRGVQAAGDKLFFNNEQTAKLQRDEGAPVDVLAEQFLNKDVPKYIDDVSSAMRMSDLINGGGNAFFHFLTNNPNNNNAALLFTKTRGVPLKGPSYDGFRQVSSIQPKNSRRVEHRKNNTQNLKVVTMRHPREPNQVYVHVTNLFPQNQNLTIDLKDANGKNFSIRRVKAIVSDREKDFETVLDRSYTNNVFRYAVTGHSVNSFVITIANTISTECNIIPYSNINGQGWEQQRNVQVAVGDAVMFGPQSEEFGARRGTWSWIGPRNFRSNGRSIEFESINASQSGVYTVTNTDPNGCTSNLQFTISVNGSIANNAVYEIQPQGSNNLRLDVQRNGTANGTLVMTWTANGRANQQWKFLNVRGNIYEIEPQNAIGKRLGIVGQNNNSQNAPIDIYEDANQQNQRWRAIQLDNNWFEFESLATPGMRLDLESLNRSALAKNRRLETNRRSQRFRLIPVTNNKENINFAENFSVFPNPVKNTLSIQVADQISSFTLNVVDVYGKQLVKKLVNSDQLSSGMLNFSTDSWVPGMYFITIDTGTQKITNKILKN